MDGTFLSYNAVLAVAQPPTVGTAGNDTLRGTSAGEVINGLGGGDWFIAGTGNDIVHGGNGLDMITFIEAQSSGAAVGLDIFSINGAPPVGAAVGGVTLDLSDPFKGTGLAQGLTLLSVERVTGSSHQDVFYGEGEQNDFRGLGGYDWFVGSAGGREWYFEIENLVGTNFNDRLEGNAERNQPSGLHGDGFIFGYDGTDYTMGGLGNDTINGGGGADFALFDENGADYTLTRTSAIDVVDQFVHQGEIPVLKHECSAACDAGAKPELASPPKLRMRTVFKPTRVNA